MEGSSLTSVVVGRVYACGTTVGEMTKDRSEDESRELRSSGQFCGQHVRLSTLSFHVAAATAVGSFSFAHAGRDEIRVDVQRDEEGDGDRRCSNFCLFFF